MKLLSSQIIHRLAVTAFGFALLLPPAPVSSAATTAILVDEIRSQLPLFTAFPLPNNGYRITDTALVSIYKEPLQNFAKETGATLWATEVVQWDQGDSSTRELLMSTLKGAGCDYKQLGETKKEDVTMTIFTARQQGASGGIVGYWIERKGQLTLVWGCSDATVLPKAKTLPLPTRDAVSPGKQGQKTAVPASLLGPKWSWTTIGGINYVNQNGQMLEPSGMSASYTFTPDGRYKFFFYVRQRTYGLVTESTTNHEGKVTFSNDNTFTVYPEKGSYKGSTGSRLIDRPMSAAERKPVAWYYEWRTENGKRLLYIGPNKASARQFKQG